MSKILIVDDDRNIRALIKYTLKEEFETVEAQSGMEALRVFDKFSPDLVLIDQRMPEMDGLMTMGQINKKNTDCKCLMITAEGTVPLAVEAMKKGAVDFIIKPFDPVILKHIVKKALHLIELTKKCRDVQGKYMEARQENNNYRKRLEKVVMENEAKKEPVDILLVEDTDADVKITLRAFKRAQFKNNIHVVEDGQEALDFIYGKGQFANRDKFPLPDLIISDINMPRMDGLELLKKLKENPAYSSIPIIVLTSSPAQDDVVKSYSAGAASYILKPVNYNDFINIIEGFNFYWRFLNQLPGKQKGDTDV